jgi:undecaprenyl-diphosphatase
MEARLLLWIHQFASPLLDAAFRVSHHLGTLSFCAMLVIAAVAWQLARGRRDAALLLLGLGLSTLFLQHGLKLVVDRPRPELWPRLLSARGAAFPSGHALAAATIYPLLAWLLSEGQRRWRGVLLAGAVLVATYIGIGRLYLGVHWPTDVLAGWLLGATQTALGLRWLELRQTRANRDSASE